ncbi:MAG TPA: alpha-L-fucosidase, partial [Porphyromonadaceae bacterium]|nr:alpha-L-fucosidase [Porphyromonadaceae bacterium]HCM22299.1 alpha-L-fucosidase [Porphyromonadaceae bacterium]
EKELIHYLVKAAGNNANLLMNVGPQPDGEFPAAAMERFRAIGKWLGQYGETIYGTRGGPVAPRHWGVTTQKADRLYVHILQKEDEVLFLPVPGKTIRSAKTFIGKKNVEYTVVPGGIALNVGEATDAIDFVVELELQ